LYYFFIVLFKYNPRESSFVYVFNTQKNSWFRHEPEAALSDGKVSGRFQHTATLNGALSKLYIFGGRVVEQKKKNTDVTNDLMLFYRLGT